MKIKEGIVLRKMPGMTLAVAAGTMRREFPNALVLNDTAVFIFEAMQKETDVETVSRAVAREYGIEESRARAAVEKTAADFKEAGILQ